MRVLTLAADLVSLGLLLGCLRGTSALSDLRNLHDEHDVFDGDTANHPNYHLPRGPLANRDPYDYSTIAPGGYGQPPPPPPSSSPVGSSSISSGFNQSTLSVPSTSIPGLTTTIPSSMLFLLHKRNSTCLLSFRYFYVLGRAIWRRDFQFVQQCPSNDKLDICNYRDNHCVHRRADRNDIAWRKYSDL